MSKDTIKRFFRLLNPFGYHCGDTQKLLFDYAEGRLDAETTTKLDKHLADCGVCIEFVKSYRETRNLCCKHGHCEKDIPPELERKLCEFIKQDMDKS